MQQMIGPHPCGLFLLNQQGAVQRRSRFGKISLKDVNPRHADPRCLSVRSGPNGCLIECPGKLRITFAERPISFRLQPLAFDPVERGDRALLSGGGREFALQGRLADRCLCPTFDH